MKLKKILLLFCFAIFLFSITACSKKDLENVEPATAIVGDWKIVNLFYKQGTTAETDQFPSILVAYPCIKDVVLTFKANGELNTTTPNECKGIDLPAIHNVAKYVVKEGKLSIEDNGAKTMVDISFSGQKMTWTTNTIDSKGVTTSTRTVFAKQ